jgi:hypothetical protein
VHRCLPLFRRILHTPHPALSRKIVILKRSSIAAFRFERQPLLLSHSGAIQDRSSLPQRKSSQIVVLRHGRYNMHARMSCECAGAKTRRRRVREECGEPRTSACVQQFVKTSAAGLLRAFQCVRLNGCDVSFHDFRAHTASLAESPVGLAAPRGLKSQ